jgi:phage terminase large subunit GpA-like protein
MPRQVVYRVRCPTCGEWAQLRVVYAERVDGRRWPMMLSCPNQTSRAHSAPEFSELADLIPPTP